MGLRTYQADKIVDEIAEERTLLCQAPECPLRWAVSVNGKNLCSQHAWGHRYDWQTITNENLRFVANKQQTIDKPPTWTLSHAERMRNLAQLRQIAEPSMPSKQWAKSLKARHEKGENLTGTQIKAYRTALKLN
jgi:hypothetical protein